MKKEMTVNTILQTVMGAVIVIVITFIWNTVANSDSVHAQITSSFNKNLTDHNQNMLSNFAEDRERIAKLEIAILRVPILEGKIDELMRERRLSPANVEKRILMLSTSTSFLETSDI